MRSRTTATAVAGALVAALVLPAASATAEPTTVASTLGTDLNLTSSTNTAPQPFSSAGDGFGTYQRGVSSSIPFALLDDSAGSFAPDSLGIVDTDDTRPFFGATDTVNNDNSGPLTATWTFDVSGATGPLFLNVEAGAMGDFEASSDLFEFTATLDGTPAGTATVTIDESASRTYTLEGGAAFTLDDPANLLGADLDDDYVRVALPLTGSGDALVVSFTADTNGGSEAFAFTNLVVTEDEPLPPLGDGEGPEPEPEPICDTPEADLTLISEVQGSDPDPDAGNDSPLDGETVTIRAVVTLADDDLNGYFVQEEPADDDDDPTTSEGMFVFDRGELPVEGQTVELTGEVTAFRGLTQLSRPATAVCDVALLEITPTSIALPLDRQGRENLEGMLVTNAQDLKVSGLFTAYGFGELGLALDGPLTQPTSEFAPDDPAALDLLERNAESYLKVNDRNEAFSSFNPYPWERFIDDLSAGDSFPAGRVVGALGYSFGEFKIEPLDNGVGDPNDRIFFPEPDDTDTIQPVPTLEDGNDVVAFNVLNYFNTFGDSDVLRGATNPEDFALQTAKIVDAILEMDAAVYGLIEIENDYEDFYDGDPSTVPSVVTLVEALNSVAGPGTFDYIQPDEDQLTTEGLGGGGLGTDAIAQALIYQPARATPVGEARTFDIDALLIGDSDNNRWPLAQTFKLDNEFVEVVVNHFKSKGSSCTDTAGPDFGFGDDARTDLTGSCNLTREYAAQRLIEWVENGATGFPTDDTLLIGDFNAYEEEGPIEILVDAGYTDLVEEFGDDAFTFKFDGRYGRLDYAFASSSLTDSVTDTQVWQINSRAPYGYLYDNSPRTAGEYPLYWASSDHDPVIVSLTSDGVEGAAGKGQGPDRGRGNGRAG